MNIGSSYKPTENMGLLGRDASSSHEYRREGNEADDKS